LGLISEIGSHAPHKNCCWLYLAAVDGWDIPDAVRWFRDQKMTRENRRGYYWMAERVVPWMHKWGTVRKMVKWGMVCPMSAYGEWLCGKGGCGWVWWGVVVGWLGVFGLLGRLHPVVVRKNGEVL